MSKILYLEGTNGISGDMTVAALLDLGADEEALRKTLDSLPVGGYGIEITRVKKAGIDACDFHVILDKEHENHDHDMQYLHGHSHTHEHMQDGHIHEHIHAHEHRRLTEIEAVISGSAMSERAKEIAIRIFHILAEAEAEAHGVPEAEVHFHEVGAVDSIVDIVAAAVCIDNLDITEVIVPSLCEGGGCIRCQHGIIPVPVPAVVNIVKRYGLILHMTGEEGEFVTPTGAALAAALRTGEKLPEHFTIQKVGIGAGKRNYSRPGILRAMLIEEAAETEGDIIYKLETNIDDCTGENLGYVMEQLFEAGARDVHYLPVYMKKNRPAYQLNVICTEEEIDKMEEIIFRGTTTIGIRRIRMERSVLPREEKTLQTPYGEVRIKRCKLYGEERIYPEYESVAAICKRTGRSYAEVYAKILEFTLKE